MTQDTACIVSTTLGTEDEAEALAVAIVEARLAACAHVQRVRSTYRWQGELRREPEWQLLLKTRSSHWEALQALIRERHSYDLPEILQYPITGGAPDYLRWLAEETAP